MRASELMRTKFLSVSVDDNVHTVLGKLDAGKHHSAIVVDSRDRYVGMFDKESCLRSRGDASQMKVRNVVHKTSKLEESTDIERVAQLLQTSDTHVLPVLDKYKRVAGIVGTRDVLLALSERLRGMRVADISTKYLVTLSEDDAIAKAIELVRRKKVARIPVVDDKRRLIGIVTRFDLLKQFFAHPTESRGGGRGSFAAMPTKPSKGSIAKVSDMMMKTVQTIEPGALLQQAVRKMADANVSDLIVVEDGIPVGILTTKDVLKQIAK
jgi:predicted transcriptional regulator